MQIEFNAKGNGIHYKHQKHEHLVSISSEFLQRNVKLKQKNIKQASELMEEYY